MKSVVSLPSLIYHPRIFLSSAIFSYRNERFKKYWQVLFAFFIASFALFVDSFINLQTTTMNDTVLDMLSSTLLIVIPIIVLTRIYGGRMASIFLKKGNIKLGLIIGRLFRLCCGICPGSQQKQGRKLN